MKLKYIIVLAWIGMAIIDAGAINADARGDFPMLASKSDWARHNCGYAWGWSLVGGPIGFIMTPFLTGFYAHGWTLSCQPEV